MPPRPCHYIIRPGPTATLPSGGTVQGPASLVPLIAVDQLPPFFEIVGAPRRLSPEDAVTMVAVAAWHTSATRPLGADDIYAIRIHVGDSPTPGDAVDAKDDESGGARLDGVVPCAQTPSRKATPTKAQTAVGTAVSTGSLTTPDAATLLSSGAVADPSSRNQDYRQMLARLTASPAAAVRAEAAITGSATASPNSSSALQGSSSNPAVVPGVAAKKQNRGPGQWRAGGKKTAVTAAVVAEGPATPAARGSRGGISDVDSNSSSGGSGQGKSLAWPQHMRKGISAVLPCKHWCHYGRWCVPLFDNNSSFRTLLT